MSVETPNDAEVFTVRVYKSVVGYGWANTYEVRVTDGSVGRSGLEQAAIAIVNAERQFHFNDVRFDRAVISTYVPDATPYNPSSFLTLTLSVYGQRDPQSSSWLPLTTCVFARFNAAVGRSGKRFYRGCLNENDVGSAFIGHIIAQGTRNTIQTALNGLAGNFVAGVEMVLARGRPAPTNVRRVEFVTVADTSTTKKLNNRYFDFPARGR